jgi:hypothetical protein
LLDDRPDRDILIRVETTVVAMQHELLGGDGREGRVSKIERGMELHDDNDSIRFSKIDRQLSYWKGAIALGGFLLIVFGAVLLEHIFTVHK